MVYLIPPQRGQNESQDESQAFELGGVTFGGQDCDGGVLFSQNVCSVPGALIIHVPRDKRKRIMLECTTLNAEFCFGS